MRRINKLESLVRTAILNKTPSVIIETADLNALLDAYAGVMLSTALAEQAISNGSYSLGLDSIMSVLDSDRNCYKTLESEI